MSKSSQYPDIDNNGLCRPKLLFVGALTNDTVFKVNNFSNGPGKFVASRSVRVSAGMAASAASSASRLGGKASLWASVGGDVISKTLVSDMELEGIDCSLVRFVLEGRSASATVIVDKKGERWVVVDYDPATQSDPDTDQLPNFSRFDAVMVDVRWPSAAKLALQALKSLGRPAILDAEVAPRPVLASLAPFATHIIASAAGARALIGDLSPSDCVSALSDRYGCFVCVTDGENGSYWLDLDGKCVEHTPTPQVDVLDTNGAGDVFHGAISLALLETEKPRLAIQFASSAAALKCTEYGGRLGAPDRTSTLRLMKETYNETY